MSYKKIPVVQQLLIYAACLSIPYFIGVFICWDWFFLDFSSKTSRGAIVLYGGLIAMIFVCIANLIMINLNHKRGGK